MDSWLYSFHWFRIQPCTLVNRIKIEPPITPMMKNIDTHTLKTDLPQILKELTIIQVLSFFQMLSLFQNGKHRQQKQNYLHFTKEKLCWYALSTNLPRLEACLLAPNALFLSIQLKKQILVINREFPQEKRSLGSCRDRFLRYPPNPTSPEQLTSCGHPSY